MAEKNRPGDDAASDRPEDESLEGAAAASDETIDDADEKSGADGVVLSESTDEDEKSEKKAKKKSRRGGRVGNFFREVVSELRKVIWPTRKELLTYTAVVVAFVTVMTSIVAGLDLGFGKLIMLAFGS